MTLRKTLMTFVGALALTAAVAPAQADAAEVVKLGTLAPKSSVWGGVFDVWAQAVAKKTDNKLQLEFFYNGSQGDEGAMVGKMKAGQLDGAAITAVGLSKIYAPVLALQVPGALTTWEKVRGAQAALGSEFEKGLADNGFTLLGWGNVGRAHLFSKGAAIKTPNDLKARKPYMWRDDKISPVFYQVIGATPVPLNVPEVLPQLKTGAVDTINAPSLAVDQLQWGSHLTHVSEDVTGVGIGALVMSNKRLESLPGDLKTIFTDTGKIAAKALGGKIEAEDEAAYNRLKGRMTLVTLSPAEKKEWRKVFKQTRNRLRQGTFPGATVDKVEIAGGVKDENVD